MSIQSEWHDSTAESLDDNEIDDMIYATKEEGFDDLFKACSIMDFRSESFDLGAFLFSNKSEKDLKTCGVNNATTCTTASVKNTGYLDGERLRWNCRRAAAGVMSYDPRPITKRSRKRSIPEEMKDDAYWKKRCQNTERARKCRETRRLKEIEVLEKVKKLENEKVELQEEVYRLKEQLTSFNDYMKTNI